MRPIRPSFAMPLVSPVTPSSAWRASAVLGLSLSLLAAGAANLAQAAPAEPATLNQRHAAERAVCTSGRSTQPRAACLAEAEAAWAMAKRGTLGDGQASYAANQRARCAALPDEARIACLARMDGQGTVSGSVEGGGLLRELVTVQPPASAPAGR